MNYPPYIFETDLFDAVDDRASSAAVGAGAVVFTLVKTQPGTWGSLLAAG